MRDMLYSLIPSLSWPESTFVILDDHQPDDSDESNKRWEKKHKRGKNDKGIREEWLQHDNDDDDSDRGIPVMEKESVDNLL